MKRMTLMFSVLAAALLMNVVPVLSAEVMMDEGVQMQQKDECLLVAMNCPAELMSIQLRIDRLNAEIAKGTDVYSRDELKLLNDRLDEAYRIQESIRNEAY
jgi:hypothetical protein